MPIYPLVSQLANFVHDWLPLKEISLSKDSPAAADGRWVKSNWDLKGLRSKIDKDEREYLYLTLSYIEFFQITGFYLLVYSLFNILNFLVYASMRLSDMCDPLKALNLVQSISSGTIVGSPVPSLYAGGLGLILTYWLFRASVVEYKALFGVNGAYEFLSEKYQSIYGGLARNIWGSIVADDEIKSMLTELRIVLIRQNQIIGDTHVDAEGRFRFQDVFKECIDHRCTVRVETPRFIGASEMRITTNCIPSIMLEVKRHPGTSV